MTRARRLTTSALLAVAGLAVTGCGIHPGAAAVIGDTRITVDDVDAAARALCAVNATDDPASPGLPTRGARIAALQFLIDAELSRQFGEDAGVVPDRGQVARSLTDNRATVDSVPADRREDLVDLIVGFRESELIVGQAGAASLQQQGLPTPSNEQSTSEGFRLRTEWAQDVEVEVDPRFGDYSEGRLTQDSGSVSVPVSERARQGSQAEPGEEWVRGLPATQKCS